MLFTYLKQVESFTRDRGQRLLNPEDLTVYINRARREIALKTACIRLVPPTSGSILNITVTDGGSGYTSPTVTISAPDSPSGRGSQAGGSQATATAQVIGGIISNISVDYGGDGYFQPSVTITDDTGSGATAEATVSPINTLNLAQEEYRFADFPLTNFPGVESVYAVLDVSLIYSNYRYSLPYYPFSIYQAFIRQYPRQYQYVPTMYTQLGQGTSGSLLMYPFPSQTYQWEPDCLCLPSDLEDDTSVEAVPQPWQDAVPYFAAHLAYLELQNWNSARGMLDLYDAMTRRYSTGARPYKVNNVYGRW